MSEVITRLKDIVRDLESAQRKLRLTTPLLQTPEGKADAAHLRSTLVDIIAVADSILTAEEAGV